ncbi:MAG: AIDA repeat-containing protein [Kiritimatiellaeota bacterium]|nr:AIDA repeat-containing protein [Kiritimatiellota bacterium]
MTVSSGGSATGTEVNNGGMMTVSSGGSANGTIINNGGAQYVNIDRAFANSTTINNGGKQLVYSGGSASGTVINNGGAQYVASDGRLGGTTTINAGGHQYLDGPYNLSGSISINGGTQHVNTPLSASDTANISFTSKGGAQYVNAGVNVDEMHIPNGAVQNVAGVANDTTVANGGKVNVLNGGVLNISDGGAFGGSLMLAGGATVNATGNVHNNLQRLTVAGTAKWNGKADLSGKKADFKIPSAMTDGGRLLVVAGNANINNATIGILPSGASSALKPGDTIYLIDAKSLTGTPANSIVFNDFYYDFILACTGGKLTAVPVAIALKPGTKILSEGRAGATAILAGGGDLAAERVKNPGAFLLTGGGWQRIETGSHVDASHFSTLIGFALKPTDALLFAPYIEAGWGEYDARIAVSNGKLRGTGGADYAGGGALLRLALANSDTSEFHIEASVRAGAVNTDFHSSDLHDYLGKRSEYDFTTPYYGAHAGIGHTLTPSSLFALESYAKWIWTRQEGKVANVLGDKIRFDAVDSQRARAGLRLAYALNDQIRLFTGAAYEYEFDGKVDASAYGFNFDAPEMKGGTGIFEAGARFKALERLTMETNVRGFTGKREGIAASLEIRWDF